MKTKKIKTKIWVWGGVGVLLVFLTVNKVLHGSKKGMPEGGRGAGSRGLAAVDAFIVTPVPLIDRFMTVGTLLAEESVELRPNASGLVVGIFFEEGTRVKKGNLLVKIKDNDLQAQLLKLKFKEKLAEEKEYRQKQMLGTGAVSQEEYDATLNELNTTRADRQFVEAQIEDTEVRAPFDGTIGLRKVSVGAFVNTNTEIATFQDVASIKIDFSVPEKYTARVRVGNAVRFRMPNSNLVHEARIYAAEPKIDLSTRTLRLRARCPNPRGDIKPGTFVNIEVELDQVPRAMVLPSYALIPGATGSKVFVLSKGLTAYRDVEPGIRDSLTVQIVKGLQFGDTVLVSGLMQLRPRSPVKVQRIINSPDSGGRMASDGASMQAPAQPGADARTVQGSSNRDRVPR